MASPILGDTARYLDALTHIPCAQLDYDQWLRIGMAAKAAGLPCEAWDEWSATDPAKYQPHLCAAKWDGFNDEPNGITAASLIFAAQQWGWDGPADHTNGFRFPAKTRTANDSAPVLDLAQLGYDAPGPLDLQPAEQLQEYARHVFAAHDLVNVVLDTDRNGRPCGWGITLTRTELISRAADILGSSTQDVGAWLRINPVCDAETLAEKQQERAAQGNKPRAGYADEHTAAYRCALIESDPEAADGMTPDDLADAKAQQLDLVRRLRLPCAAIVDSGHKSIHAIVRVDAENDAQYRERVRWLHAVCNANGFACDPNNKNPSRMSRLPGAVRGSSTQLLVGINEGLPSWDEWRRWIETDAPKKAAQDGTGAAYNAEDEGKAPHRRRPSQAELVDLMRTDPDVMLSFGTNTLDGGVYVTGPLPWSMLNERRRWQDADAEHLFMWASAKTGTQSRRDVLGAFTVAAAENRFNPIAEMLDTLPQWDGTARADYMLWALFGCEDTPYTRTVSHTFMRGAVLRGYQPGCKFDSVLVLIGRQGCGKSIGVRRLAMRDEFLCESVSDLTDHKLTAEQVLGRWIVELAELEGMTGRRLTAVKQALTMQKCTVRLAYAKHPVDLPRSCVFCATTNEAQFLADPTGARRFWPVRCAVAEDRGGWNTAAVREIEAFIMLAWAEIVAEYKAALQLPAEQFADAFPTRLSPDMELAADEAREAAAIEDTDAGAVQEWLAYAVRREGITRVCARQVAERALGIDMGRERNRRATANVTRILDNCPGWQFVGKQRVQGYGIVRAWDYTG